MSRYFIEQKITAFANQYRVFDSNGDGPGKLVAFVHQKRLAIKEAFLFYEDEAKTKLLFQIKARNIMEMAATYDVTDNNGKDFGHLKKDFSSSLLRSTWQVCPAGSDSPIAIVRERSMPLAIARRVWGLVPYIGDLPFMLKYHFDFLDPGTQKVIGTYTKTTLIRDHYRLDLNDKLSGKADWRLFVAMGVGLDALQSR